MPPRRGAHSSTAEAGRSSTVGLLRRTALGLVVLGLVVFGFIPYALFATRQPAERAQAQLAHSLGEMRIGREQLATAPSRAGHEASAVRSRSVPQSRLVWPRAIPLGTPLATITIPAAGVVNDVVVQGVDELRLEEGPGHYPGTPLPGDPGNIAIAGHRTTWLRPFYNLQALRPGDVVTLQVRAFRYVYHVVSMRSVAPGDVSVLAPRRGWWLTLTTCNPRYSAAQRLVVQAERIPTGPQGLASQVQGSAPQAVAVGQLAPARQLLTTTPPAVLALWCAALVTLVALALWGRRRHRSLLLLLLPAAACLFEAYGAAVSLLPASW